LDEKHIMSAARTIAQPVSEEASLLQTVIDPPAGWQLIDWRELWQYRDLLYFLVWRDIKTRYAQSILGVGWAVIQPVFSMIVFTVVFGSGGSLIGAAGMITKVYFPRLVIPIAPVVAKLLDFAIAMLILFGLMLWFRTPPTVWALTLPLLVLLMMLSAAGMGMWLTALAIQYRDVKYGLNFGVQLLMYASPVVYPASKVPEQFRLLYGLNPMAGVIEGFRSALLGTNPMPWDLLAVGTVVAIVVAISGAMYFGRMERVFADVV
jgi:lipopolysaccharide transport system permease protein